MMCQAACMTDAGAGAHGDSLPGAPAPAARPNQSCRFSRRFPVALWAAAMRPRPTASSRAAAPPAAAPASSIAAWRPCRPPSRTRPAASAATRRAAALRPRAESVQPRGGTGQRGWCGSKLVDGSSVSPRLLGADHDGVRQAARMTMAFAWRSARARRRRLLRSPLGAHCRPPGRSGLAGSARRPTRCAMGSGHQATAAAGAVREIGGTEEDCPGSRPNRGST
jgi:hypothetical protein